ncbi:MAG: FIST C-terminal domain-containing protein [Anaerolineae bacterium]|nr:FIST C-terminal domain-containing protein [Anaerolineae bacterium]
MAGKIKKMLDQIIETRSKGDYFLEQITKTKLIIKGINPDKYHDNSPDTPKIMQDVRRIAQQLGVTLQKEPVSIKPVYSMETSPEKNAAELAAKLSDISATFVLFFASSNFEPAALGAAMQAHFPTAIIMGCTTAGEIANEKMLKNSVVAMAFDAETLEDVAVGVVQNLSTENQVPQVFADFERHTGQKMIDLDIKAYVGLALIDGLSLSEEKVMDKIGDLTDVLFVGGSAGDDLKMKATYVFANGEAYTNAAVLALLKPKVNFEVIKTQSFRALDKVFKATRVNEAERIVYEFDGQPASKVYAQAVGLPIEEAGSKFFGQPLGLMVGDEPYVRAPGGIQDDAMMFFCQIKEGMELSLLEATNIIEDTRSLIQTKKAELQQISGLIHFHCLARTVVLEEQGQMEEYAGIFADIPTVGFCTYGEQYLGHVSETSTMLLFT